MLIGIHGKARAGKDEIGRCLRKRFGFATYSFAAPIWRMIAALVDAQPDQLARMDKEFVFPAWGFSLRQAAQTLGTDWGRQMVDPDIWIKVLSRQLTPAFVRDLTRGVCITDVRFENEASWIRKRGGQIWHVERAAQPDVRAHASEAGIERLPEDVILRNDGSRAALWDQVMEVLQHKTGTT